MKNRLSRFALLVVSLAVLLLLFLGIIHVIDWNVVIPSLFPIVILMLGLAVYVYEGAEKHEDRNR